MKGNIINYDNRFKLPWQEHLEYICKDFRRRCNPDEWRLFFERSELDDGTIFEEIAIQLIVAIEKYHNFSKEVICIIEERFQFSRHMQDFHFYVPLEFMEVYESQFVKKTEFPPYKLLQAQTKGDEAEDIWQHADEFIDTFRDLFFHGVEDPKDFYEAVESLKELKFTHPYTCLLESDHYNMLGDLKNAIDCLKDLEDNYYKCLQLAMLTMEAEDYEGAIAIYQQAIEVGEDCLDPSLIEGLLSCYLQLDMADEMLGVADQFIAQGYDHVAGPYKEAVLSGIYESICEIPKEELTEEDAWYAKEYHKSQEDFESVLKLCQYGKEQGYQKEFWAFDMLEALFECGHIEEAIKLEEELLEEVETLRKEDELKVRKVSARLAFEAGDVCLAYEIIDDIMDQVKYDRRFCLEVGKMFRKTGRTRDAYMLLTQLVFYFEKIEYYYELGRCYLTEAAGTEAAFSYFEAAYQMDPEYENVAYYLVQAAIDSGDYEKAVETYGNVKEHICTYYRILTEGQFLEMQEKITAAEKYYETMVKRCNGEECPKEILDQLLERYLIMVSQRNEIFLHFEKRVKKAMATYYANRQVYNLFGEALLEVQDFEGARDCFQQALEMDFCNSKALRGLAICNIELGEQKLSYEYCTKYYSYTRSDIARSLFMNWELKFNYGEIKPSDSEKMHSLCKEGKQEKALEYIASKVDDDSPAIYYRFAADLAIFIGDEARAKYWISRFEDKFVGGRFDLDIANLKARMYLMMGAGKKAYTKSLEDDSPKGMRLTGIIQLVNRKEKEALEIFEELIRTNANDIENYIGASFSAYLLGDIQKSKNYALKGLNLFDRLYQYPEEFEEANMYCDYGYLNALGGYNEKAQEALKTAISMETCSCEFCKGCDEGHLGLAVLRHIEGDDEEAKKEFEMAFAIQPNSPLGRTVYEKLINQ